MTNDDMIAAHEAVGERYTAAAAEFLEAFIDLAAHDRALCNANIGHAHALPTFGQLPDLVQLQHPLFLPRITTHLGDCVREQCEKLVKAFTAS